MSKALKTVEITLVAFVIIERNKETKKSEKLYFNYIVQQSMKIYSDKQGKQYQICK